MPDWKPRNTARARELRNAATPAERELWKYLSNSGLDGHKFTRQMQIGPFYADLVCRRAKLIVEIDGDLHGTTGEADARRTNYLEDLGYAVIRFSNADVTTNVEGVCTILAQALADRPTPSPSLKREGSR